MTSRASLFRLRKGEVHVWATYNVDTSSSRRDELSVLSDAEKGRAALLVGPRTRSRFIHHHWFVRAVLARYLGRPPGLIEFDYGAHGKPFVTAEPDNLDLQFSLAHSFDLGLVTVTLDDPIGIDVERVRDLPMAREIVHRCFSPAEARLFDLTENDGRQDLFFRLWAHKEATVKALGSSLETGLTQFTFEQDSDGGLRLAPSSHNLHVDCIETLRGYEGAIARCGPIANVRHFFADSTRSYLF